MDLAGTLARELGAGKVLGPEAGERLDDYGRDECDEARYRRRPDCVVFAEERADVEAVVRICRERKVPITPRGAGSGKAGGCVPLAGGVVLSTERMRRLVEVDGDDLVAVAEPGVITGELQEAVEAAGMFYPPDPASLAFSTIGGNVVTNAGGPRAFKYGVTREYVLGLEVVLMSGEVLRIGRRTAKGVTGYDLVAGFVGSEGTLGVVTEVVLKLVPRPAAVRTALAVYPDVDLAGAAISALLHQGFRPRTLELMDRTCIEATRGKTEYRFPEGAGAAVLFELDGEEDGLEAALERAGGVADAAGAREVLVARDERDRRNLWQARRELSLLLRAGNRCKVGEDICVPRGALGAMIRRVDAIGAATGIRCATFGHAGDGNLHVQFLLDGEAADPAVRARVDEGLELLFRATVELGGTLSGEHGIGVTKARYLPLEQSPAVIEWQRRIKQLWDPDGLLNPGKLFPPRRAAGCSE